MPKVSVIIPVYNVEEYLTECLESVIDQTEKDIEIICVDDGSTDGSGAILDEYVKRDDRVKVIHKENGGVTLARKLGVEMSTGKYITFVDSDDWIEPNMYEVLYSLAEKYDVDWVTSGYIKEGNYQTVHTDGFEQGVYKNDDYSKLLNESIYKLEKKDAGLRGSLCTKFFKKEKIEQINRFIPNELTMSEDKMCVLAYTLNCASGYVLKKAYYHYRINNTSATHTENTNYLLAVNHIYQFLLSLYSHPKFTAEMRKQAEIYITEMLIAGINTRLGFENKNMLWIDPYWLEKLPPNTKIVLYGAGELGRKYKKHIDNRKDIQYVGCVDPNYEKNSTEEFEVLAVEELNNLTFDYVVITIKNPEKANSVKEQLCGIFPSKKILWFEQNEIFWKYVEADGLI